MSRFHQSQWQSSCCVTHIRSVQKSDLEKVHSMTSSFYLGTRLGTSANKLRLPNRWPNTSTTPENDYANEKRCECLFADASEAPRVGGVTGLAIGQLRMEELSWFQRPVERAEYIANVDNTNPHGGTGWHSAKTELKMS